MTNIPNTTASHIKVAALALKQGHLVAFPTETVYGLGADATNEDSVARIYKVKGRPTNHPLIVHVSSMDLMDKWASEVPEYAIKLARAFWPGPMTLVVLRSSLARNYITGSQDTVAIRVPSHTLANQLLQEFELLGGFGVAAPSANRFGKVSPTTCQAVYEEIGDILSHQDQILDGGQSQVGIESTIIDCTQKIPTIFRPGATTKEEIEEIINLKVVVAESVKKDIKVPGSFKSHYAPNAKVLLSDEISPGNGFIALEEIPTPDGAIRLGSPKNVNEFAHILYSALRRADARGIKFINVVPPINQGLGFAITDRLLKASHEI